MKKFLLLLVSMLVLVLAACGSNSESSDNGSSSEEAQETAAPAAEENEVSNEGKTDLLSYQGEVIKVIRNAEATFAGFTTPEGIEAAEVKPADAAAAISDEIAAIEIPETLADYQKDLTDAANIISQFYIKKAEILQAGSEDLTEAETLKQNYIDAVNKVFEKVGVSAPTFDMVFM
ncbi:hypothetical protein [Bacillus litorisediminis]|uniref:hypothetical protein n=1 Tax=Bacillus litorisediminis TaxID=2922713 RepID=UPI001FADBE30|nr:hypothetical protein [Bacillus litorisediminis]